MACHRAPLTALLVMTSCFAAAAAPLPALGDLWSPSDADRDRPAYHTSFGAPSVLEDWLLEGGETMQVADGRLVLAIRARGVAEIDEHHLVCWLRREIPGDFLPGFAVRPQNRKQGLNIVFFNARGRRGESIFGPVWVHSGWLGLRQMAHTVRRGYDELAVYPLR